MSKVSAVPDDLDRYGVTAVYADDDLATRRASLLSALSRLDRNNALRPGTGGADVRFRNYVDDCRATDLTTLRVADAFRAADNGHHGFVSVTAKALDAALRRQPAEPRVDNRPGTAFLTNVSNASAADIAGRFGVRFNSLKDWQAMSGGSCGSAVYGIVDGRVETGTGYVTDADGLNYPLVNPGDTSRPSGWTTVAMSGLQIVTIGETGSNVAWGRALLAASGADPNNTPPLGASFYASRFGIDDDGVPYVTDHESPAGFTATVPDEPKYPWQAEGTGTTNVPIGAGVSGIENLASAVDAFRTTKNADLFATRVVYQRDPKGRTRAYIEAYQAYDMGDTTAIAAFVVAFGATGATYLDGRRIPKNKRGTGSRSSYVLAAPAS
ncbi:MAG: hypothetical protein AB7L13_02295 [Acidimicrobiia bacterium]